MSEEAEDRAMEAADAKSMVAKTALAAHAAGEVEAGQQLGQLRVALERVMTGLEEASGPERTPEYDGDLRELPVDEAFVRLLESAGREEIAGLPVGDALDELNESGEEDDITTSVENTLDLLQQDGPLDLVPEHDDDLSAAEQLQRTVESVPDPNTFAQDVDRRQSTEERSSTSDTSRGMGL